MVLEKAERFEAGMEDVPVFADPPMREGVWVVVFAF